MNGMLDFDIISTGLRTIAVLFIVIGLLVLTLFLMKKLLFSSGRKKEDALIKVLSSVHLSPKERIELIEVSGELIVVGVAPGRISLLANLNDQKGKNRTINGKK